VVGRHFQPWPKGARARKPSLEIAVAYDRTRLSTAEVLKAKATLKYHETAPTYQVIVELPIPPGFTAETGDLAKIVKREAVEKVTQTGQWVTVYLGQVKAGSVQTFSYRLRPKVPLKVKAPAAVAYEYYTPANRATSRSIELTVVERK
jgi:hypothetical protein